METPVPKKPKSSLSLRLRFLVRLDLLAWDYISVICSNDICTAEQLSACLNCLDYRVLHGMRISFPWIAELSAISVRLMLTWACQRGVIGR
ncbi:hypothetical protein QQP08_008646 [Theobroma cacao]|nr:hypothetical protein QQP08_008646 [Theobroma cacao]